VTAFAGVPGDPIGAKSAPPVHRPALLALAVAAALAACAARPPADAPVLRVGTSGDYAPFSLERDGDLEGLDVEVARRFARDTGRRLELVRFRWPDLVTDLAAGRFDAAMGGVTVRPERALAGTFTRPILETGTMVLTRVGVARTVTELDRHGLRMAVNAGGHLERVARRAFPQAILLPVDDNRVLPRLLADGLVEAIVTDDVEARLFAPGVPMAVALGPVTRDRKAYLARDAALAAELDRWVRAREIDGTLAMLRERWLGMPPEPRTAAVSDVEALLALVDLRLALMPAVAAAKEAAGLAVADPAQEARVLEAARERAAARGLAPAAVQALFEAQIAAARAVQRDFLATPPAHRPPVPAVDLQTTVRPALATLSLAIVERAADVAAGDGSLGAVDPDVLAERLDPTITPRAARLAIGRAVAALVPRRAAPLPPG
jgi:cyclohexadienyl dehydratase